MAKIIDSLRQAEGRRAAPAGETSVPAVEATPAAPSADEPQETMPFIEVGGKDRQMSASPDVLACPGPRLAPVPPPATSPAPLTVPQPAVPLAVTFQPWPSASSAAVGGTPAPELIAYHQPDHPVSRQYARLLDSLLASDAGATGRVFLFTAAAPGVGATTAVLNLAITACGQGGRRVAVVDLNLRRPALAARLGVPPAPGVAEVLAGTAALEQAIQPTRVSDLFALAAGKVVTGTGRASTAEAARWLVRWLGDRFDAVFVDGPAWGDGADVAALAPAADAVYAVLTEGHGQGDSFDELLRGLTRCGGRLRGLIQIRRAA
jgi:Mrp family chromosome partitioning ATPase